MLLPIIQSLWIGEELSPIECLSIASFIKNGHHFHLYTYGEVKNIPEGTIIKDANDVLSVDQVFTYNNGSYAGFADWFRWKLLYEKGNFWVDTDVVCLKPFKFSTDVIFGLEIRDFVCPAVLGFPKGHDLCAFLEENCRNPNRILPYDSRKIKKRKIKRRILGRGKEYIKWGESGGPVGFSNALRYFGLLGEAKSFVFFYPIHSDNWNAFYDDTLKDDNHLFKDTYAIHLWNEMSRRDNFDKKATFHKDSLVEQLKNKYL